MARKKGTYAARARSRVYRIVRRAGRRKPTVSMAVLGGLAVPAIKTYDAYKSFGLSGQQGALSRLTESFTGYNPVDNTYNFARLKNGLAPVITGAIVHKVANMLGINRMIAGAGIPFIRI